MRHFRWNMKEIVHFTIPGEPVAQGRARRGKWGNMFDPEKSRNFKKIVSNYARAAYKGEPVVCPVIMELAIYRKIPASWSKGKKQKAIKGDVLPISKPDCSNYLKGVEDALNGIIYKDDSQIVGIAVYKAYSEEPRTCIRLAEYYL